MTPLGLECETDVRPPREVAVHGFVAPSSIHEVNEVLIRQWPADFPIGLVLAVIFPAPIDFKVSLQEYSANEAGGGTMKQRDGAIGLDRPF